MSHFELIEKKKQLIKARKAIKEKMKLLTGKKTETSKLLQTRFEPIVEPLKDLVKAMKTPFMKLEPEVEVLKQEKIEQRKEAEEEEEEVKASEKQQQQKQRQEPKFLKTSIIAQTPPASDLTLETVKKNL